ncbi:structural maintenance of chromosome domain-containing protein [Cyclospora cayetanensis]|uniref:Structural maintenance of chromosome domain-containing protein n=1 Tax=Cyclospora cayetanensis TaxID=88456 RepID=A0A1D3CZE1_9EIME|nr:structural maintenance of chromosome domain-containing protein [Cyclospora cayetanensis]
MAEAEGWNKANGIAGLFADFISVAPEYHRAVESIGGFALFYFVLEDATRALEVVTRLKRHQQQQKSGLPTWKSCVSLVPLKEVHELQQARQRTDSRLQRLKQQAHKLLEEGVAMPLTECIHVLPEAAGIHAAALEVFIQSIFGRALLVPSLDTPEVKQWNDQGFECVTLDGDVSFASGALRGGCSARGVKLAAFHKLRECEAADYRLEEEIQEQQQALKRLQARQKCLLEDEQLLVEAKLEAHLRAEASLATQQKAKMALRAAASLLSALKEEEAAAASRTAMRKQVMQRRLCKRAQPL